MEFNSAFKGLTHYPTGCPRRRSTRDLFISSYHISWLWQIPVGTPHGPHRVLCSITSFVTSTMEFMEFKRCRYQEWWLTMQSWCTGCYQVCSSWGYMATMAVAKGMLHNRKQYTDLLMIHWGIHTQSGWNVLEHYLAEMTPVT